MRRYRQGKRLFVILEGLTMKHWRLWAVVGMYGALYGFMGGVLALQDPRRAAVWFVAMVAIHVGMAALLWRWKVVRRHG